MLWNAVHFFGQIRLAGQSVTSCANQWESVTKTDIGQNDKTWPMCRLVWVRGPSVHTSYLSYLLHGIFFWILNITTFCLQKVPPTPTDKKKMQFCQFNLENLTPGRKFLHRRYWWCLWQIWGMPWCIYQHRLNQNDTAFNCLKQNLVTKWDSSWWQYMAYHPEENNKSSGCGCVVHISTWIQLVRLIGPMLSETPQPPIFQL